MSSVGPSSRKPAGRWRNLLAEARREVDAAPGRTKPTVTPRRGVAAVLDANRWGGSAAIMTLALAVLWAVTLANVLDGHHLTRFGLRARTVHGLLGIATMPVLHADATQMLANTFPFVIIGTMALVGHPRVFLAATTIIVVVGGAVTWLIGPSGVVVGANGLVVGWLAYLLARAVFARRLTWILGAAFALFLFSGLFSGLVPTVHSHVAWQAHVAGFAAGVAAGWWLHPRNGRRAGTARARAVVTRSVATGRRGRGGKPA